MSGEQLAAEEEQRSENESSDSSSPTNDSESEQEQSPAPPSRKPPQKNQKTPGKNDNPKARKDKKKKFRKQNRTKGAAVTAAVPSIASNPHAFAFGALPPAPGERCSSAAIAAHDSTSSIAAIAQKEVLRAIGNALLHKVDQ